MNLETVFWVIHLLLMAVFAAGIWNLFVPWRKSALPAVFPHAPSGWGALLRAWFVEGWFNRRLGQRSTWRWAGHFLLLNGFLLLALLSAVSVLFEKILPLFPGLDGAALAKMVSRDQPLKAFLNDTGSLMMSIGWLFYAVRRYLARPAQLRSDGRDSGLLLGLGLILLTGWLLEAVRINAVQSPAQFSYIGVPLAQLAGRLPLAWGEVFELSYLVHGLLASALIAAVPYSKFMHALAASFTTALSANPAEGGSGTSPEYTLRQHFELNACTRCGECIPWCPTYQEKPGSEAITPLQKIAFVREAAYRRQGFLGIRSRELALSDWQNHAHGVYDCTLCGRCAVVCPVHIRTRDLWINMRAELAGANLLPEPIQQLSATLTTTHNLAGDPANDRSGWSDNLEVPPSRVTQTGAVETLYFVGCVASQYPQTFSIPRGMSRILERCGESYGVLGNEERCCGFPLIVAGLRSEAAALARHNLETVRRLGAKTLLTTCPSCYRTWKEEYPRLLGEALGFEMAHAVEWLADKAAAGALPLKPLKCTVTYHDPCDLGRSSGLYDAPRAVIRAVPDIELIEMAHSHELALCCGGGGDVEMVDKGLTSAVAQRRMDEARSTGAELVLTACQQCVRTLSAAAREMKSGLQVSDLVTFIAKQML
ncbi:MAG: 4Fe-4S dicluster domain-containing protein [Anaerolineaceae bacterium]|nr:4Fe-4S dicluster domain-containing protein [Anaerolineaceae bacterium]